MRHFLLLIVTLFFSCTRQPTGMDVTTEISPQKEMVCFVYHRFGDARFPSTNILLSDFEAHLSWLQENDYQVLTFSEGLRYLQSDEPEKKTAVITIDDGYKSFFTSGLPLLRQYNMPATLFINTETVGSRDYMDWEELKIANVEGIEIGNHTHTHEYFLELPQSERYSTFRKDIEESQDLIEEHLDLAPTVFAYPYGEFDERMKEVVKEAGFVGAAAQNSGIIHSGSDLFQCTRFPMSEAYATLDQFVEKAQMHSLPITAAQPASFILEDPQPTLTLTFAADQLQTERMQCFVQGSNCQMSMVENTGNEITITLQSTSSLTSRRRTLYTLTVPDSLGGWYWYSHLWINTKVP